MKEWIALLALTLAISVIICITMYIIAAIVWVAVQIFMLGV